MTDTRYLTDSKAAEGGELFQFICGCQADNGKNASADCSVRQGSLPG